MGEARARLKGEGNPVIEGFFEELKRRIKDFDLYILAKPLYFVIYGLGV